MKSAKMSKNCSRLTRFGDQGDAALWLTTGSREAGERLSVTYLCCSSQVAMSSLCLGIVMSCRFG